MTKTNLPIVVYQYTYSPYARRIQWYLQLRGIPYSQCIQPPIMPRPDVAKLGIKHRRIPILSIGRDVYLDTRLIIQKLEAAFPSSPDSPYRALSGPEETTTPEHAAITYLLTKITVDTGGLFTHAAKLIPSSLPLTKDPAFRKDRADFFSEQRAMAQESRPEAVNEIKQAALFLETGLLADGRDWILQTERPSLADLEAIWPFHWLTTMPGALPEGEVSATQFPKLFGWVERFKSALAAAKQAGGPKPESLDGDQALRVIVQSSYSEPEGDVDASDGVVCAEGLAKGSVVALWPTDTGTSGRDVGKLVSMSSREVVIETATEEEDASGGCVRVHAPRHGFRVKKASADDGGPKL